MRFWFLPFILYQWTEHMRCAWDGNDNGRDFGGLGFSVRQAGVGVVWPASLPPSKRLLCLPSLLSMAGISQPPPPRLLSACSYSFSFSPPYLPFRFLDSCSQPALRHLSSHAFSLACVYTCAISLLHTYLPNLPALGIWPSSCAHAWKKT